ncbi:MAG: hypothetical protein ACQCXQ_06510 [Verrucomicrobiales bacterium]|nr:hypothetical protein [Verrucomicrobiota bacterium JB025]
MKKPLSLVLCTSLIVGAVVFIQLRSGDDASGGSDDLSEISAPRKSASSDRVFSPGPTPVEKAEDKVVVQGTESATVASDYPAVPAPDGSMPQGTEVLPASSTETLGDPAEHGGVIIPSRNSRSWVPGLQATATVKVGRKSGSLTPSQRGIFPEIVIVPNGRADITLTYPELDSGEIVHLDCPDGGTIDGDVGKSFQTNAARSVSFTWQGNSNLGRHSICCVAGPDSDEKTISFWVGPRAYADASSVPR